MTSRVENLIHQFLELSPSEQQELLHIIRTKGRGDGFGIEHRGGKLIGESIGSTTINFAPAPGRCPRCGK